MNRLLYILAFFFVAISIWFGSGSLAPYAATHAVNIVSDCQYLYNIDNPHFYSTYAFLRGDSPESWITSVMLRRILFPVFAYPFMLVTNFYIGGVLASLVLNIACIGIFLRYYLKNYGIKSGIVISTLLATFPGITYYAGLPYAYSTIVPLSLISFLLLDLLLKYENTSLSVLLNGLALGFLGNAYDFVTFFLPAGIFILIYKKKFPYIFLYVVACMLPIFLINYILTVVLGVAVSSSINDAYAIITSSYLNFYKANFNDWWLLLSNNINVFTHNFFYSTFVMLPSVFIVQFIIARIFLGMKLSISEKALALAVLTVWLFNNMAPPYEGWQMRGEWIARIYQVSFVVYISYIARTYSLIRSNSKSFKIITLCFLLGFFGQLAIILGPLLSQTQIADNIYYNFYRHSIPGAFTENINKYGARPLGFCRKS